MQIPASIANPDALFMKRGLSRNYITEMVKQNLPAPQMLSCTKCLQTGRNIWCLFLRFFGGVAGPKGFYFNLCRAPALSHRSLCRGVRRPSLYRGLSGSGLDALCVGPRRSLVVCIGGPMFSLSLSLGRYLYWAPGTLPPLSVCRAPALSVSGARILCVGPRRSRTLFAGALNIGSRSPLPVLSISGPGALNIGPGPLLVGAQLVSAHLAALSKSGPGALACHPSFGPRTRTPISASLRPRTPAPILVTHRVRGPPARIRCHPSGPAGSQLKSAYHPSSPFPKKNPKPYYFGEYIYIYIYIFIYLFIYLFIFIYFIPIFSINLKMYIRTEPKQYGQK